MMRGEIDSQWDDSTTAVANVEVKSSILFFCPTQLWGRILGAFLPGGGVARETSKHARMVLVM